MKRDAGLEAADNGEVMGFAIGADISLPLGKGAEDFGNDVDWIDPQQDVGSAVAEVGWENANDLYRLVIESEATANHGAVTGKVALPETEGEKRATRRAECTLLG